MSGDSSPPAITTCPECGVTGRKVGRVTLQALLTEDARERLSGSQSYRFCKSQGCRVVYFGEREPRTFHRHDVRVPIFQKSTEPSRLVCYCFEHKVSDIEDEVRRTGASFIPDAIGEQCKAGLDHCEEMNPQGSCCLGNVRQVMKQAQASLGVDAAAGASSESTALPDCCAAPESSAEEGSAQAMPREHNVGMWSAGGALTAAVLSYACCWLPLALIGFGVSAAGVAGFFETYRIHFLAVTALLLGTGFYFVYVRKPKCAPGEACAVPNPKLQRFNKVMLWTATVFVLGFAAFPNYVGYLLGGSEGNVAAQSAQVTRSYAITGMTCEGCSTHVKDAVEEVPGVSFAEVSYENETLRVHLDPDARVTDAQIIAAVEALGYHATRRENAG